MQSQASWTQAQLHKQFITGRVSIGTFASAVGLHVGIALSGTRLVFSLPIAITRKSFKIFTIKQEKHNAITLLAQSKLDSITDIISQAMQDGDISSITFHKVLQEIERCCKLKADIKSQAKTKVRSQKNSENNYLTKEEKKANKTFYKKWQILQVSRVQGVSAI